ncbi:unnamed protein product [Mucor circinelloides]|uniref:DUF7082 domain-containing protein n=1 Tax=Mucor circinelloides f. circinelloides (strain 1006PhL) TaxID=1220926 RepID=S2JT22_MUCC1|nr:hypothetical protein HMPREF1544_10366 [Mucor circinelloides 1006PhL]
MDSSDLSDIPAVRLASGVEMQQRWPPSSVHSNDQQQPLQQHQRQQQKNTAGEAPRLIELAPTRGSQGTVVTVVVQSLPHQIVPVKLAFNSLVVDTKQMQAQGITSLVAAVPPFQHTHSTTANVPISICMLDRDSVTETWPVAEFVYDFDTKDNNTTSTTTPSTSSSSISTVNDYNNDKMPSDITSYQQNQQQQPREENFLGGSSTPSNYDSFYQQPVSSYNQYNGYYNNAPRDVFNDSKYNQYRSTNQARPNQQAMNSMNYNSNPMNLFTSNAAGFTGMLTGFDQNDSVLPTSLPQTPLGYQQQVGAAVTPQRQSGPTTPSAFGYGKSSVHVPSTSVANYQPYPGLVSRANLKIMGDLDSMAKNWAADEWEHRRRLVQFWREQNGNEIRCTFDPVAQGERITSNSGHIVVSCIYWAERNDCFITSVDCIHLLESLMDIRFSVEEKNRVRRNLEGFRPLTVSKCKAESADFFKLIMSFPNPKPRNIEKDVKVFPWKTLPYALKKIVTKYTASSYNNNSGSGSNAQHQRRAQLKSANATPTLTPPPPVSTANSNASSYMNVHQQDSGMNSFYSTPHPNIYQQPQQTSSPFAYQPSQQQQEPTSSMYQSSPSSVPAFTTSSYTQSSPVIDSKDTPSPRLQYPYNDMLNSNSSAADDLAGASAKVTPSSSNQGSPSLDRRPSLDNQQDYLVNFKNE